MYKWLAFCAACFSIECYLVAKNAEYFVSHAFEPVFAALAALEQLQRLPLGH